MEENSKEKKMEVADAQFVGGMGSLENDNCKVIVGCNKNTFEMVVPILLSLSSEVVHCGGTGSSQVARVGI